MNNRRLNKCVETPINTEGLDILARHDLEETVVEMVRRFGGENRETAFLRRIFCFDPDCELVWVTQFQTSRPSLQERRREEALIAALFTIFVPDLDVDPCEDPMGRWQEVTRTLVALGERVGVEDPWLYGWFVFGVKVLASVRTPRVVIWDSVVSRSVYDHPVSAEIGQIYADLLPSSAEALLDLPGVGPSRLKRMEAKLEEALIGPAGLPPTLEEMLDPDFRP